MNFSLKMLLALLAYAALLCASILTVNPWWAEILLLVTFFLLAIAASLALFGRTGRRPAYGAFALTAGAYLLLTVSPGGFDGFPTHQLAQDWNNQLGQYRARLVGAPTPVTNISTNYTLPPAYAYPSPANAQAPYPAYANSGTPVPAGEDADTTTSQATDADDMTDASAGDVPTPTDPAIRVMQALPYMPNSAAPPPTALQPPPPVSPYLTAPVYAVAVTVAYTPEQTRYLMSAQQNFPRVCHAVFGTLLGLLAAVIVGRFVRRSGQPSSTAGASDMHQVPPSGAS